MLLGWSHGCFHGHCGCAGSAIAAAFQDGRGPWQGKKLRRARPRIWNALAKSIKARARSLRQSGEDGFACDGKSKLTNPYSKDTTACGDDEPLQQPPPPKRTKTSSSDQQLCLKPQQMPVRICRRRSDVRGERLGGFTGLEYRRMRRAGLPVWCSWEPSKRATRFL